MTEVTLKYIPSGDSAFIIKAGDVISEEVNLVIRKLSARLEEENIPGVIDFIPSYNELMVCYDPKIGYRRLLETLRACAADPAAILLPAPTVVH
ncbi:MAG: carboxyltransferase domain-containing protein [Bacteroidales bacterium]